MNRIKSVSVKEVVELDVKVLPRSSTTEIAGFHNGAVKVKLKSPPAEGKANAEICRFIADCLGISKSKVIIKRGLTSTKKTLLLSGVSQSAVEEKILYPARQE